MKVVCDRAALMNAVNLVAAVAPSRTPSPALSHVKLTAGKGPHGGELVLAATDAETALSITLTSVDVAEPGTCAVLAEKLRGIVSAEEGEPTLTLESTGGVLHIKGVNAHFRVMTSPSTDFPPLPEFQQAIEGKGSDAAKSVFAHPAGELTDLIGRTTFATARETSRYAINGVLLKRDGKKLEMVATDGRRLAVAKATLSASGKGSGAESASCIVPTKALSMIGKLTENPEDMVRVAIADSRIFFAFDGPAAGGKKGEGAGTPRAVLSSTLVEGAFPPYEDVIPKDQDKKIVAGRDDLSSAVRKAAVLTNEESRGVRLNFTSDTKRLKLSSRAPEMGEAEIEVGLSAYEGDDVEISFNPQFISDVLRVLGDDQVIVELKASNKPGLIRSKDNDFMYVVMPVNLPN